MARPRVFISSTFFDLRQIRSELDRFIEEMGYEPIRNESGEIAYGNTEDLEQYCYKEVHDVDILVGIIGNRYGSTSSQDKYSITQLEIKTALTQGKHVYVFIDKNVNTEYGTYFVNKGKDITYKYADNIKIYEFIEEIHALKTGVIIHPFEHVNDITEFLKTQWAGLFRDYLRQSSQSKQLSTLSQKIVELSGVSETLVKYMENILTKEKDPKQLVSEEQEKLKAIHVDSSLASIWYIDHLINTHGLTLEEIKESLTKTDDIIEFLKLLKSKQRVEKQFFCLRETRIHDLNTARVILYQKPFSVDENNIRSFNKDLQKEEREERLKKIRDRKSIDKAKEKLNGDESTIDVSSQDQ